MNDVFYMALVFLAGFSLGTLFFLGLWFTVKKAMKSKKPALWIFGSLLLRVTITLFGFYYVSLGNWIYLIICLSGFIMARFAVVKLTKTKDEKHLEIKNVT